MRAVIHSCWHAKNLRHTSQTSIVKFIFLCYDISTKFFSMLLFSTKVSNGSLQEACWCRAALPICYFMNRGSCRRKPGLYLRGKSINRELFCLFFSFHSKMVPHGTFLLWPEQLWLHFSSYTRCDSFPAEVFLQSPRPDGRSDSCCCMRWRQSPALFF